MPDFEALAWDIQNRASHRVGAAAAEKRHFHEFFGTCVLVVKKIWELLERDSLLPKGCRPKHLLWALHFMKVYPKQSPGCSAVGALARLLALSTRRPTASGSGHSSTPSLTWSTLWRVKSHVGTGAKMTLCKNAWGQSRAQGAAVDGDDGPRCST